MKHVPQFSTSHLPPLHLSTSPFPRPFHEHPNPILAPQSPSRPESARQLHLIAHAGVHGAAAGGGKGNRIESEAQRLHLPREWGALAELPDHDGGPGLQVFALVEAAGETPRGHHADQWSASPGQPQSSPQLHQYLPHRRQARPLGSQHDLCGPKDGRNHRAADASRLDGDRAHAELARLDR